MARVLSDQDSSGPWVGEAEEVKLGGGGRRIIIKQGTGDPVSGEQISLNKRLPEKKGKNILTSSYTSGAIKRTKSPSA